MIVTPLDVSPRAQMKSQTKSIRLICLSFSDHQLVRMLTLSFCLVCTDMSLSYRIISVAIKMYSQNPLEPNLLPTLSVKLSTIFTMSASLVCLLLTFSVPPNRHIATSPNYSGLFFALRPFFSSYRIREDNFQRLFAIIRSK